MVHEHHQYEEQKDLKEKLRQKIIFFMVIFLQKILKGENNTYFQMARNMGTFPSTLKIKHYKCILILHWTVKHWGNFHKINYNMLIQCDGMPAKLILRCQCQSFITIFTGKSLRRETVCFQHSNSFSNFQMWVSNRPCESGWKAHDSSWINSIQKNKERLWGF